MLGTIALSIGQVYHLKSGKDRVVYAGMPSEDTYSIVQLKNAAMNNAVAWNLYFSKRQRNITIDAVKMYIENITPEEIRIRLE
jgi:hypothetical protein